MTEVISFAQQQSFVVKRVVTGAIVLVSVILLLVLWRPANSSSARPPNSFLSQAEGEKQRGSKNDETAALTTAPEQDLSAIQTSGPQSPIISGDHNQVNYHNIDPVAVDALPLEGEVMHPHGTPGEFIKVIVGGHDIASAYPEMDSEFFVARRDSYGRILVSTTLYDQDNTILAIIKDNKFKLNKGGGMKLDDSIPNEVKIEGKGLSLHLRLLAPGDTANLEGEFFCNGQRVTAGQGATRIGNAFYMGNKIQFGGSPEEFFRKHWEDVERREREVRQRFKDAQERKEQS